MDDGDACNVTCSSSEPHDNNIKEHLFHFLGCIEISERRQFLNDENHPLWKGEIAHLMTLGRSLEEAHKESTKKRKKWKFNCESELRRIDFLREKLSQDTDDQHLVRCAEESGGRWRASDEYKGNIDRVKAWRKANKAKNRHSGGLTASNSMEPDSPYNYDKRRDTVNVPYDPAMDVSVPIIQFENSKPADDGRPGEDVDGVWGNFPDQKTNVKHLLDDSKGEKNLLYKGRLPNRIKYFHIPVNNMTWAEEAVARYYNQKRPNFHAIGRELRTHKNSESALILKESHWRGQLHGGRTTTNSRFMRPFCELISSSPAEVENDPKNLVLFLMIKMPYMHWETSRNREKFAQLIEEIVYQHKQDKAKAQIAAKKQRQSERNSLTQRTRVPDLPNDQSVVGELARRVTVWIKGEESDPPVPSVQNSEGDSKEPGKEGEGLRPPLAHGHKPRRSLRRIYTISEILRKHDFPRRPLKMDDNDRLEITNPLGQYLIDAALLYEGMTNYRDKKILEQFLMKDPPMHPRRTLDQAYYWSLNTTRSRDMDQVVYRATTPDPAAFHSYDPDNGWKDHKDLKEDESCEACTANIRKVSRVIMVDQLWMWILDEKTIITCFPKRYGANKHDSSGVHKSVRVRIGEGRYKQVKSVFDLALIILEECSNTFFDRTRVSDKQPQVLDAFSEAIGNIMHKQTVAFERLWRWTDEARKIYRSRAEGRGSHLHIPLLDINPEGELEREIKDIVEELGIMIHINKTHRDVFKQFVGHVDHVLDPTGEFGKKHGHQLTSKKWFAASRRGSPSNSPTTAGAGLGPRLELAMPSGQHSEAKRDTFHWFMVNADEMATRINDRIEQLEELERSARATATSVKDLLELKQQQASCVQAWQSVNQSNEAISQGRSIMMFTIVTIVFLPLSFMATVFGMNAHEFSDDNKLGLAMEFKYMFSVSAGVIAITLFFSLSAWSRAAIWYLYKRSVVAFCVHTGLYRQYLDVDWRSDKLYKHAIDVTEKLKDREVEARLARRREQRKAEDEKRPGEMGNNGVGVDGNGNGNGNGDIQGGREQATESYEMRAWWKFHRRTGDAGDDVV